MFGFQIGFKELIDIFLVAWLLHRTYKILKRTGAVNIFLGILAFIIFWFVVVYIFRMELLGGILDRVVSVGAFGLIVLFQDEIRRFFSRLGTRKSWSAFTAVRRLIGGKNNSTDQTDYNLMQIVLACRGMAKSYTGALIVITREHNLGFFAHSGEQIDADINSRLIETIFFKNSPLHDGALIVTNRRLVSAACILPVSKNQSIPKRMGLRHRAAMGITEQSDAVAIIVSEETGHISYAVNGKMTVNVKPEQLELFLSQKMQHL